MMQRSHSRAVLIWALILALFFTYSATAAEESKEHIFELKFCQSGFLLSAGRNLNADEKPFAKEPDFQGRRVWRGNDPMATIWDSYNNTLYLDLNGNGDLTDDPHGVFKSVGPSTRYQFFTDVDFHLQTGTVSVPYRTQVSAYNLGSARILYSMSVHSGFSADIELYGKKWRVGVADNLDGKIGLGDHFYLEPDKGDFGKHNRGEGLDVPETVFFDGRSYELKWEFIEGDTEPVLKATFIETQLPTRPVTIKGERIKRLIFRGNRTLALLDQPPRQTEVPKGCLLKAAYVDGSEAGIFKASHIPAHTVPLSDDDAIEYTIGGPLNNSVKVQRTGNVLKLEYDLIGRGGESYTSVRGRRDKPPTFAVYSGDRKVGSGDFEYG